MDLVNINKDIMAEFSKQYCEIYDEDFPWDFDIEVEAETIPKGYYKPMICEGFGFLGIGKTSDDKIQLYFGPDGWIDYDKIVK